SARCFLSDNLPDDGLGVDMVAMMLVPDAVAPIACAPDCRRSRAGGLPRGSPVDRGGPRGTSVESGSSPPRPLQRPRRTRARIPQEVGVHRGAHGISPGASWLGYEPFPGGPLARRDL